MRTVLLAVIVVIVTCNMSFGCTLPVAVLDLPNAYAGDGGYYTPNDVNVYFDGTDSYVTNGSINKYEWDFHYNGSSFNPEYTETATSAPDGIFDGRTIYKYTTKGTYLAAMRVTSSYARSTVTSCKVRVGNVHNISRTPELHYDTIAAAISDTNTVNNDVIVVIPGSYRESIEFTTTKITLRSVDPEDWSIVAKTIICDNQLAYKRLVTFDTAADSTITGFTLTGGAANWNHYESSTGYGGGIYCYNCDPTIKNCIFYGNLARFGGGGIYNGNSDPNIINCLFIRNSDSAIYNDSSNPKVVNCVFYGNTGQTIYNSWDANPDIINCTFYKNEGGTVYDGSGCSSTVTNCISWDNGGSGGVSVSDPAKVTYCDIQDWLDGGTGNIITDPGFTDNGLLEGPDGIYGTRDDMLYPGVGADCIDAGNDSAVPAGIDTDIALKTRQKDGNHNALAKVDMGAYELPRVWLVDGDNTGSEDGKSWSTAWKTLQAALLSSANPKPSAGDEIWVADGTYCPDEGTGQQDNSRSATFRLLTDVDLYGGFLGGSEAFWQRDFKTNKTILSGEIQSDAVESNNSYRVVYCVWNALLDGFWIVSGYGGSGAGIDSIGANSRDFFNFRVQNCVISHNKAPETVGAGICVAHGKVELINSFILDNTALYGGGLASMYNGHLTAENCVFTGNRAVNGNFNGNGGALYIRDDSYNELPVKFIRLNNCTIYLNGAAYGGGMYIQGPGSNRLVILNNNCIFWGNGAGGGIYSTQPSKPQTWFRHCDIEGGLTSAIGTNWGGNINSSPSFLNPRAIGGTSDGKFGTSDDGLYLNEDSPCIDAGDGIKAPQRDITETPRFNRMVSHGGSGQPSYTDIGAYENSYRFGTDISLVSGGQALTFFWYNGRVYVCGGDIGSGSIGTGSTAVQQIFPGPVLGGAMGTTYLENMKFFYNGYYHLVGVDKNGYVWSWGYDDSGQLGNGSNGSSPTPCKVLDTTGTPGSQLGNIAKVVVGHSAFFSMALEKDHGYVFAWGANEYGQLGTGDDTYRDYPVYVHSGQMSTASGHLEYIKDIDAGVWHSIAVDANGYVWTWGNNVAGQLGNGTTTDSSTPVWVSGVGGTGHLSGINDVAACSDYSYDVFGTSFALDEYTGGYVYAWGNDRYGQLGDGEISSDKYTPVIVNKGQQSWSISGNLESIVAISAGDSHVLALDQDGNVWAWGNGEEGQLGDGSTYSKYTPVRVKINADTYLTDIVYIDAGTFHSLAVDSKGRVWGWGLSNFAQFGIYYLHGMPVTYAIELFLP